jgi:hypothetical protein
MCPKHVCEPQIIPRIACSKHYKRTRVHRAVSASSAGWSVIVGVRASRAWPLAASLLNSRARSRPSRCGPFGMCTLTSRGGPDWSPGRPPPFEASGRAARRRVSAVFAGFFERGAAQAADDRAVFDLLGRELDAAWLGQARALHRRPPPAPLGGFARTIVALVPAAVFAIGNEPDWPGRPGTGGGPHRFWQSPRPRRRRRPARAGCNATSR